MIRGEFTVDLSPLEGLRRSLVGKILRKAVREATKPVKDAAKANAQELGTGNTAKSFSVKVKVYKLSAVGIVGPRSDFKKAIGVYVRGKHKGEVKVVRPSWTLHFLEGGAKRFAPKPVLRPAYTSQSSAVSQIMQEQIKAGIQAELNKL